jgi:hypothetical protein
MYIVDAGIKKPIMKVVILLKTLYICVQFLWRNNIEAGLSNIFPLRLLLALSQGSLAQINWK